MTSFINSPYPSPAVMKTISYQVGKRIAHCREKQSITQAELGERIGLEPHRIYEFENGLHRIDLEVLYVFAMALGVPAIELIGLDYDGDGKRKRKRKVV